MRAYAIDRRRFLFRALQALCCLEEVINIVLHIGIGKSGRIKGIETARKEIRDYPSEDHIAPIQSPALYVSRSAMRRLTFGTSSNWASNSCRERFTN